VHAKNENFAASFAFDDGSVATLTYTSMGSTDYPKELLHVYAGESVFVLNDFHSLEAFGPSRMSTRSDEVDKGHAAEMRAFVAAVKDGGEWPIPLWQQVQATRMALDVERRIDGPA
jgi:predicted dehydrogenase